MNYVLFFYILFYRENPIATLYESDALEMEIHMQKERIKLENIRPLSESAVALSI